MPIQLNCPKCPQRMEFRSITSDEAESSRFIAAASTASGTWERVAYTPPERFCRPDRTETGRPSPYPGRRSRQSCDPNAPTNKPQAQVVKAIFQRFFGRSEHAGVAGSRAVPPSCVEIHE